MDKERIDELNQEEAKNENLYAEWKRDNLSDLQRDFIDGYEEQFEDYCKEEFNNWRENK